MGKKKKRDVSKGKGIMDSWFKIIGEALILVLLSPFILILIIYDWIVTMLYKLTPKR